MGSPTRFLRIALSVAALVFAPVFGLAAFFGAPSGDLVRVGAWSARDFGWRSTQPVLRVRGNRDVPDADADVLVLGDSFSMGNVWQSVVSDALGVRTLTWGYEGHACLDAFAALAASPRFAAARHVVVQTIERHLLDRFASPPSCARGPVLFEGPPGRTPAARATPRPEVDWRYLSATLRNTLRLREAPTAALRHADTVNLPLARRDLFSNRRPDRLLHYAGDDAKIAWTAQGVERAARNALALQRQVESAGKSFTLVVVPDKSTVYRSAVPPGVRPPPAGAAFAPPFERAGVHLLPLEDRFERLAFVGVDFYLPDDTHLSSRGFEALGRAVAERLAAAGR